VIIPSVRTAAEVSELVRKAQWSPVSAALAPADLLGGPARTQWDITVVVAEQNGEPVGVLPLWRSRRARFAGSMFEPAKVAPALFSPDDSDATSYLFVGGAKDLTAGYTLASGLSVAEREAVAAALVGCAFREARTRGLTAAALYVRQEQVAAFEAHAGSRAVVIEQYAEMVISGGDLDACTAALSHSRRSVIRRDLRALETFGIRGSSNAAAEVIDEAAPLITKVKERHGISEHPRLVAMRLHAWAGASLGRRLAFVVRAPDGTCLAVSFGCHHGASLEMYEIGLADSDNRHLAYVEALIYAPLRFAAANGCRILQLGLGSSRPKMLRGASTMPVWAVRDGIPPERGMTAPDNSDRGRSGVEG
jgi:hypothetical protein